MTEMEIYKGKKVYPTAKVCPRTELLMGKLTTIGDFCFICSKRLEMRDGSMLGRFVEVSGRGEVLLKEGAVVASHASLLTSTDTTEGKMNDASTDEERAVRTGNITLGEYSYVGQHATIMPGVTIGDWAVIGAYSYIDKDVPANTIIMPDVKKRTKVRVVKGVLKDG